MNILVFIDQYERGGAARVTSTMINGLVDIGYNITLATNVVSHSIAYPLDSRINTIAFYGGETHNKVQSLKRHIKLIVSARNCVKAVNPDIIITVLHNPYFYVRCATWGSNIPLIAVDHTSFSRKISRREDWTRNYFYKFANTLSILTEKDKKLLGDKLPNKVVIYNPLSFPPLDHETKRLNNILVAGRLSYWKIKGIDRIIEIWSKLAAQHPEWVLEIAGDGDEKSTHYLKELVYKAGVNDRVIFLGQVDDMKKKLSETSVFALPSRIEGFPMVLMEAMSQGCSCIAFSLEGSSNEMMTSGKSGIIIEDGDIDSFAKNLHQLLDMPNLRDIYGRNAIEESKRFTARNFINKWDSILKTYERI